MLFASFPYILAFLPLIVLICIALQKYLGARAAMAWILAASIFFYAKSNPFNLIFLVVSILGNWFLAGRIAHAQQPTRKRLMIAGVTLNILYLGLFKYLGFVASTFAFALPHGYVPPKLPFPLGISFFTIMQIMYLVDCYEDIVTPGTLFEHATFVSFFPYVISGPLARAKRMRHQFGHFGGEDGTRATTAARGIYLFSLGLFKKAVLADTLSQVVVFGSTATNPSAMETWLFSISYALQLYFDFSGYSDMAIGSALMLGIEIPRNFDAPYTSKSIIEFWQRWHISLTGFITTYLFTPIFRSFKKRTVLTSSIATFIAMGIAGLWHGPAWTFVVYGFLHGAYLAINQIWRKQKKVRIPAFLSWMITFTGVVISFIYFRSDTVGQANALVLSLFNPHHAFATKNISSVAFMANGLSMKVIGVPLFAAASVAFFGPSSEQMARDFRPTLLKSVYAVCLTLIAFVMVHSVISVPFVYFRF